MSYSEISTGARSVVTALEKSDALGVGAAAVIDRQLMVDSGRILERLQAMAKIGRSAQGGINRIAYSSADVQGRAYVMDLMRAAGLETSIDAA